MKRVRKLKKGSIIKARVDRILKGRVSSAAVKRNLDESDIVRLAVAQFLSTQSWSEPTEQKS